MSFDMAWSFWDVCFCRCCRKVKKGLSTTKEKEVVRYDLKSSQGARLYQKKDDGLLIPLQWDSPSKRRRKSSPSCDSQVHLLGRASTSNPSLALESTSPVPVQPREMKPYRPDVAKERTRIGSEPCSRDHSSRKFSRILSALTAASAHELAGSENRNAVSQIDLLTFQATEFNGIPKDRWKSVTDVGATVRAEETKSESGRKEKDEKRQETRERKSSEVQSGSKCIIETPCFGIVKCKAVFEAEEKKLDIYLEEIANLVKKGEDQSKPYDVVVKLLLLPNVKDYRISHIGEEGLSLLFEDKFSFDAVNPDRKTLLVSVFEAGIEGKHDAIGSGHHTFGQGIWPDDGQHLSLPILPYRMTMTEGRGVILLSLSYQPSRNRLSVVVVRARELRLPPTRLSKSHDIYTKVELYCKGERVEKKKSRPVRGEPDWNESFQFYIPLGLIDHSRIVACVKAHAVLKRDPLLGCAAVGPLHFDMNGSLTHWGKAMASPAIVTRWHHLYL